MIQAAWEYLGPWSWWVLALVLLGLEITAPGMIFIWLAVGAIAAGGLALSIDTGWQTEVIVFVIASTIAVLVGRNWLKRKGVSGTDQPHLNSRVQALIGREFTLGTAIENGVGQVRIDDTVWRARGPNLPSGTQVRVTGCEGTTLQVAEV